MKICIYGTGGAGCVLGEKLFTAGADITLIARGRHYEALRDLGLLLITPKAEEVFEIAVTDDPSVPGPQDYIIISSKAYSVPSIAEHIEPLCHNDTAIIPASNGIPWWFLFGLEGPLKNQRISCLDPEAIIEEHIPYERVIGGLFYMAATLIEPGVVSSTAYPRFIIGEPSGEETPRIRALDELRTKAGFKDPLTSNIRSEIWLKLCWNVAFNPLGAITRKNSGDMAADPDIRATATKMMEEMQVLAETLNIPLDLDIAHHMELTERAGQHKPSMLQDVENSKPLEIDAIIGAVVEIAEMLGISIPHIKKTYESLKKLH